MFKVQKGMASDYLKALFHFLNNTSNALESNNLKMNLPKQKTDYLKAKFVYCLAASWNKLPSDLTRGEVECQSVIHYFEFLINLIYYKFMFWYLFC